MTPPRLVALRALGLGDFLTGVPAYRALAEAFPEHRRLLAAPRALAPLIPLVGGAIDALVDAAPLSPLPRQLHGAAVAVNLHGRGPQSHNVLVATRPSRLIAFVHADVPESRAGAEWRAGEHEVARWCRMLRHAGIAADPSDLLLRKPEFSVSPTLRHATVLHPGAASPARRWPVDRWIAVARQLRHLGHRVVVSGSDAETPLARAIVDGAGLSPERNVAGKTGLHELAALVSEARLLLATDTGIAHLATAYRRPSILLFGPTSPVEWGPPTAGPHRVLWLGRTGDPHAQTPDPGLLAIGPIDVMRAIAELEATASADCGAA